METYELFLDEETKEKGVFAISLVSDPAIESDWIALSKDVKMAVVDDDKHILMGAALIPNKLIPRKDKSGIFNVYFSEDTVRKASEMFLKNGFQSETTLEHAIQLDSNTVSESWIKEDNVHDKSVKFGIDVPVGTWLISMKIEDDSIYQMAKDGLINGFSIEGRFADMLVKNSKELTENVTEEPINSYNNMSLDKKTFLSRMEKLFFGSDEEVKEENREPVITAEEIQNAPIVDLTDTAEEPVEEVEVKAEEVVEVKEPEYATKEEFSKLSKKITELSKTFTKEKEDLEAKNVELQKQVDEKPDAEKIVHSPEVKEVKLTTNKTAKGRITAGLRQALNK